jgi:hypothetical protein
MPEPIYRRALTILTVGLQNRQLERILFILIVEGSYTVYNSLAHFHDPELTTDVENALLAL